MGAEVGLLGTVVARVALPAACQHLQILLHCRQ
jgi:hypothetical protein